MSTFRLAHLSDPHFGAQDSRLVDAVPDALRELKPDAVIVTGDFTMAGRRGEFTAARAWLDRLPGPVVVIPGNHDIPKLNHLFDRFFRPFRRYRKFINPNIEQVLRGRGLHLAAFNSSRPFGLNWDWSGGRLSLRQLMRLEDEFAKAEEGAMRIVALHHPTVALPENERELVGRLPGLRQALGRIRADLVLGGHFHQSYAMTLPCGEKGEWETVVSQVSTVTSVRLQGEPNGFHLLKLGEGELEVEKFVWREDEGAYVFGDAFAFTRDSASGWHSTTREETPAQKPEGTAEDRM